MNRWPANLKALARCRRGTTRSTTIFREAEPDARSVPSVAGWFQIQDAVITELQKILVGQTTPQQAADAAAGEDQADHRRQQVAAATGRRRRCFQLGFSTIGCPDYDVDQVVALAKDNGYAGVEIRFLRGTVDLPSLPELSPERIARHAAALRRCRHRGRRHRHQRSHELARSGRAQASSGTAARANLAIAEGARAKYLRVFGGPIPPDQDREKTLDAIASGLGEVADLTSARRRRPASSRPTTTSASRAQHPRPLRPRRQRQARRPVGHAAQLPPRRVAARRPGASSATASSLSTSRTPTRPPPTGFDFALTGEGTVPVDAPSSMC